MGQPSLVGKQHAHRYSDLAGFTIECRQISPNMEEEDDDLYDPADTLPHNQGQNGDRLPENADEAEEFVEEEVEDDEVRSELYLPTCLITLIN